MIRNVILYALAAGLIGCLAWYVIAMRRWLHVLCGPQVKDLSEQQRAEFASTPEYVKLRGSVRTPIMATLIVFAVMYLVMRFPA